MAMLLSLASCSLLLLCAGLIVYEQFHGDQPCEMTYMYRQPQYKKIYLSADIEKGYPQYGLYYYHEGAAMSESAPLQFNGVPALFIPGNAGSHKQSRSSASIALQMHAAEFPKHRHFDFFTVKLNEELSGLYGGVLERQTMYVASCIERILSLYPVGNHQPRSVVVIAHSMGGVLAQALFSLPSFNHSSLHTIIALSSPLARPVLCFDQLLHAFYHRVNKVWSEGGVADHVTIVSIAGGRRDIQIPTHLTRNKYSIDIAAPDIPRNWASADHQAIVWCRRVQLAVTRALFLLQADGAWELTRDKERRERVLAHLLFRGKDVPIGHTHSQLKATSWKILPEPSNYHHHQGYKGGYSAIATPRPQSWNHSNTLLVASNTGQLSWVFACSSVDQDKHANCSDLSHLSSQLPPKHGTIKFLFLRADMWPQNSTHLVLAQPRQLHPKALDKKGFVLFEVCDDVSHVLKMNWLGTKHTIQANHCTITNFTLPLTEVWLVYNAELRSCDLLSVGVVAGDGSARHGIGIELSSQVHSGTSNLTLSLTLQVPYEDTPPQLIVWSQRNCKLEVELRLDLKDSVKKLVVLYAPLLLPWVTAACITGSDSHAGLELAIILILYALTSNAWIPLTDWQVLSEEGVWSVWIPPLLLCISRGLQQAMAGCVRVVLACVRGVCVRGGGWRGVRVVTAIGWICLAAAAVSLSVCSSLSLLFAIVAFAVWNSGQKAVDVVCVLLCLQLLTLPSLFSWIKGLQFTATLNPDPHFYIVMATNVVVFVSFVAGSAFGLKLDTSHQEVDSGKCQQTPVRLRSLAKLGLFVPTLLCSLIRAHHLAYFALVYVSIIPFV